MILELDTSLLKRIGNISINQLVFLTLLLNDNQGEDQDIHEFLSRISENEIKELIDQNLVYHEPLAEDGKIYLPSKKLVTILGTSKSMFDEFCDIYPIYVTRPDGTKGFLKGNYNRCKERYYNITKRSRAKHEELLKCLKYDINQKITAGKMGYMKTMWNWLVSGEYETIEQQMSYTDKNIVPENNYGGTII